VERYGTTDWPLIASYIPGRSELHCQHRWEKFLDPQLIKGPWTKEVGIVVVHMICRIQFWSVSAAR